MFTGSEKENAWVFKEQQVTGRIGKQTQEERRSWQGWGWRNVHDGNKILKTEGT